MKLGVLTSSRADYGVYQPLLQRLIKDNFFEVEIIAFGTHLSKFHGYTLDEIKKDSYKKIHTISSLLSNDDIQSIATSYGLTVLKFAGFWADNNYDAVLCLGDRFEMSAAVQAGVPFGIRFIHIGGGETTLGAIDNVYRHQITLASDIHFVSTKQYAERVSEIIDSKKNVYVVGSLSLDNINKFKFLDKEKFIKNYGIPEGDFALITFHPETILSENNFDYAKEMSLALSAISERMHLVITMPNADTAATVYRNIFTQIANSIPGKVTLVENFGKLNYFSAMKYSKLMIGNTSSGIIEAASFNKYVINVGIRQKGRLQSNNVTNCKFSAAEIIKEVNNAMKKGDYAGDNVYAKDDTSGRIIEVLKSVDVEKL